MNDLEARLARALESQSTARPDPSFRLEVIARRERAATLRVVRALGLLSFLAAFAGLGFAILAPLITAGSADSIAIAAAILITIALLTALYRRIGATLRNTLLDCRGSLRAAFRAIAIWP